jgi:hypothetical protein
MKSRLENRRVFNMNLVAPVSAAIFVILFEAGTGE